MKKEIRFLGLFLTAILVAGLFLQAVSQASADEYDSYRSRVDTIYNDSLRLTEQLHRLDANGKSITGICNLSSMEMLLNRRVAYDFGDYSGPFDDYDMFQAVGVSDLGGGMWEYAPGKHGYYLSGSVGSIQRNGTIYRYSDSVSYHPVLLGNPEVTQRINWTGLSGLDAQYAMIASLLREHPEGIWLRAEYGTHAILITDYQIENGRIQLYAIDPVNVRRGIGRQKIENLYFYSNNYKNGMISDMSQGEYRINIAYLEQVGGSTAPHQVPASPAATERVPTLSISEQNAPGTLEQGGNFGIRGIITTDCGYITQVYGAILDVYGNAVQSSSYAPYDASHNLRYSINNDLLFGRLPAGEYVYFVQAQAVNGSQTSTGVMISQSFTVRGNTPANSVGSEIALDMLNQYMTVNVGKGSTLRFCSTVSVADQYEIGSIPNAASVYVYGITQLRYEDRIWAKINYNGTDGWVNYKWLA